MGKLIEDTKAVVMHRSNVIDGTATYGLSVDTLGYDDVKIVLNVGDALGDSSLAAAVYEADQNVPANSVAVTNASFAAVTSANEGIFVGGLQAKNHKRYIWLRLAATAAGTPTIGISAIAELGKGDSDPTSQTASFDVE